MFEAFSFFPNRWVSVRKQSFTTCFVFTRGLTKVRVSDAVLLKYKVKKIGQIIGWGGGGGGVQRWI